MADFPNQLLAPIPKRHWEHSPRLARRKPTSSDRGVCVMLGKLAGAWLGEKVAGPNQGAKGAILGYGAAAVARRSVPALAAVVLGGWAFRKWRDRRRSRASYPSEATPLSPSD
jgi:hypothetical protein